jgi:uncharacterized protein involved in type VI secretion and phage assembly
VSGGYPDKAQGARRCFGKYRGTVVNNVDPKNMGRLQVSVPAVYGSNTLNWAMPCTPYAGSGVGLYLVPAVGANVWVEFEAGDIDFPVWAGCFWNENDAPATLPTQKVLKTAAATVTLDDLSPDSVTIESTAGHKITLTAAGAKITTSAGAVIELTGPSVSVNNGALDIR